MPDRLASKRGSFRGILMIQFQGADEEDSIFKICKCNNNTSLAKSPTAMRSEISLLERILNFYHISIAGGEGDADRMDTVVLQYYQSADAIKIPIQFESAAYRIVAVSSLFGKRFTTSNSFLYSKLKDMVLVELKSPFQSRVSCIHTSPKLSCLTGRIHLCRRIQRCNPPRRGLIVLALLKPQYLAPSQHQLLLPLKVDFSLCCFKTRRPVL